MQLVFLFTVVTNTPVSLDNYVYPAWADGIGWLQFTIVVLMIPVIAVVEGLKIRRHDRSLSPRVRQSQQQS